MFATQVGASFILAILGAAVVSNPAGARRDSTLELQPESRIWISGTSTVRGFQCQATAFEAKVASEPGAVAALLAGTKAVTSIELVVPAEKLDCRNGTMNEHMRKALKAKDNPTIAFRVATYELAKSADGVTATLHGTLALGGVEKPITVTAQAKGNDDGQLIVTGTHEVRMTEFGLKPPTLMLGTMKVDERIKVGFEIALKG